VKSGPKPAASPRKNGQRLAFRNSASRQLSVYSSELLWASARFFQAFLSISIAAVTASCSILPWARAASAFAVAPAAAVPFVPSALRSARGRRGLDGRRHADAGAS
jgi:hypothetical protein